MSKYNFINNEFVIEDYDKEKPFASFLPGIAGINGIPLWCHYTNRAQAITSFGLRDKNGCILEFYPANTSYRIVDKLGFRTFIKVNNNYFEPFKPCGSGVRKMYISPSMVRIVEENSEFGLFIEVAYFNLPGENIGGLVRRVNVKNIGEEKDIELLDGLTQLLPTDANEWMLKHQSNLLKSWMDVKLLDNKVAFYFENSVPSDTAEVIESTHGNYYISFVDGKIVKPLFDANVIFGFDTSLSIPVNFINENLDSLLLKENIAADKVSMGFSYGKKVLKENDVLSIDTVIGYSVNEEFILNKVDTFAKPGYFDNKMEEITKIISNMTNDVSCTTNYKLFDEYMKQNYLDNILRGGYPLFINANDKNFVYHLFSRRHGDMEREYNFFSIAPEYYSQGNGNFRDVCQNRRSDSLFHKEIGISNAYQFASLIQLDGYNPLGVLGKVFELENKDESLSIAKTLFDNKIDVMSSVLSTVFTPGSIFNTMEKEHITSKYSDEEILRYVFSKSIEEINADFGEGYWSDHWTYILDLVENSLNIEPEKVVEYLYKDHTYKYYDSPVTVLPRSEKYCITQSGKVRQFGALLDKDEEKIKRCNMNPYASNWLKDKSGSPVFTSLFGKLYTLCLNKFSLLDQMGIGISMEANKPGWNDAMNGLPGIFASGVSETIELGRLVEFLIDNIHDELVCLPTELIELEEEILDIYKNNIDSFIIWDKVTTCLETFREKTRFGVSSCEEISTLELLSSLKLFKEVIDLALEKALEVGKGIYPTFLSYKATDYTVTDHIGHYNLKTVKVNKFELDPLPYFLEAPARSMKYIKNKTVLKNQYELIKKTKMYDTKLKVYKTSESLDNCSYDIGRVRAFQKGWLERESDFLHMTYKYLLGLLKSGLYQEFYEEIKTNFTCFMDPSIYGRNILENSSFIATSNNPDSAVHGEGFVARLSGSTAEMLSIWNIMMFGDKPFIYKNDKLILNIKPKLSKDFFNEDGIVKAKFMSFCDIEIINNKFIDTFNASFTYVIEDNSYDLIEGVLAEKIRSGLIKEIKIIVK